MAQATFETGFQKLGEGIYCCVTSGRTMMSNCMLVEGEKCALLFDVLSTKPMTRDFLDQCRQYTQKPIRYLVLSHCHGDHFLGAGAVPEAIVLGGDNLKAAFDQDRATGRAEKLKARMPELDWEGVVFPYPDVYLRGGCDIDLGDRVVQVLDMGKCHTERDFALWVPDAKVMALADVLFYHVVPPTISGDIDHWLEVLEYLEGCEAERFLPGHGPVCGKEGLRAEKEYFRAVCRQAQDVVRGTLAMEDDVPSPLEQKMIDEGWLETARTVFSVEQYAARLRGEPYHADLTRVLGLEQSRNR